MDDLSKLYINDRLVNTWERQRDSGWLDINAYIHPRQENRIRFITWNNDRQYTWGYELKVDDTIVWQDEQGEVGFRGAGDNDLSRENQTVYDKTLLLTPAGQLLDITGSPDTWQVRLSNIDDFGGIYLNGNLLLERGLGDDTGWFGITDWMLNGYENSLRFTIWNRQRGGYAVASLALRRNNKTIWSEEYVSSDRSNGLIYDQNIYIDSRGDVTSVPEGTRWYVRNRPISLGVHWGGELTQVSINGVPFLDVDPFYGQDLGWVEFTHLVTPGEETVLRFLSQSARSGISWDFALMRNNAILWEERDHSDTPYVTAYDYSLYITAEGELTSGLHRTP